MCAGAVLNARISRVVFAAFDPKDGAAGSCFDVMRENRKWFVEIIPGVLASEGERMLREFFMLLRRKKNAGFPAGKDVHDGC
jgi:tRNA(adenine34) deaminase